MQKNNFDFLRFLFAFVVVLFHIVVLSQSSELQFLKPYFDFYLSITGFFIISGFLVTSSYHNSKNIKQYFIKRGKRLLPAYITVVLISAIFLSLASSYCFPCYFKSSILYKYIIYNLLFLNFLQPCLPGLFLNNLLCSVNGALWTIKIEVCFYLILPIIIIIASRIRWRNAFLVFLYLLSLLYQYLLYHYSNIHPESAQFAGILKHQLPGFMTYFVSGIALYYNIDWFKKNKIMILMISLPVFLAEYYLGIEIFRPAAFAVIILSVANGFRFLNNFGKYGDFSYGIYIFHYPIIQLIVSLNWFKDYNPWFIGITTLLIISITAVLSWKLIEKKFLKTRIIS